MPLTPFESALVLHLVADWLLQNEWMAVNKVRLTHPAAWVHSGIHGILLGALLGWKSGILLGVIHLLVDTRVPLLWWVRVYKRCQNSPDYSLLLMGCDQVIHVASIAAVMSLGLK